MTATDLPDAVVNAAAEEQDTEGGSLTDHDRAVLWQALGQCFSTFPNSPESCAMVDAMVEQIVTSHVRAAAASGPWAEQLDAASPTAKLTDTENSHIEYLVDEFAAAVVHNRPAIEELENLCVWVESIITARLAAALARNAELEATLPKRTHDWLAHCKRLDAERDAVSDDLCKAWKELGEVEAERTTLRAELDSLRSRVTALADEWESDEYPWEWELKDRIKALRALVRGSDDE